MRIEVIYALPDRADSVVLELPEGARVQDALQRSGLCERHPEIMAENLRLGVFGRVVDAMHRLADGDRVEVYRSLLVDAKEVRRNRAGRPARRR